MSKSAVTSFIAGLVLALGASTAFASDPVAASTPATAAPTQTAPAQSPAPQVLAAQAPKRPGDEVICKREEETGSRLGGKKVCMTKDDWAQQSRDARDGMLYNGTRH